MPTLHRTVAAVAALVILAGCSHAQDGPQTPGARADDSTGQHAKAAWRYDYAGQDTNAAFSDVAAASADDAWAIAKSPVTGVVDNQDTHLFHYDGQRWQPFDLPPALRRLDDLPLVRLEASGPRDMWLFAGIVTHPDRSHPPLAAHWNGTTWRTVRLPHDFPQAVRGAAVFSPDDAWAVDGSDTAWHWDGQQWQARSLPAKAQALAGTSGKDLWAVGSGSTRRGQSRPAALRWDGSRWKKATLPAMPPGPQDDPHSGELTRAVALSAQDVRAFGQVSSEGGDTDAYSAGLALRWDGTRWSQDDGVPCCVSGQAGGVLFLTPKRYLTSAGRQERITQPPCPGRRSGKLGESGCRQKLQLEEYAAIPESREVWGVGSVRGQAAPSRPVIVRLRAAP
ncbi:hypothetical protein [Streptomyces sp. SYP-A7185]|uniref:hypothetical protein n=1 Tax=Streptomyces sp. SYP-A7185 TaxID=3040076 RepID=UPI0038F6E839